MGRRAIDQADMARFDEEYFEYLANREKYVGIKAKQENNSWQVGHSKPTRTVRTLSEAVQVRDQWQTV